MGELHCIWSDGNGGAEHQFKLRLVKCMNCRGIYLHDNKKSGVMSLFGILRKIVQIFSIFVSDKDIVVVCWMYRAALVGVMLRIATLGRMHVIFEIRHGLSGKVKFSRWVMVRLVGFLSSVFRIPCIFNSFFALENHVLYGYSRALSSVRWNSVRKPDIKRNNRNKFRKMLSIPEDSFVICSIGRNVPEKNLYTAVEAFRQARLPSKVIYLLVGSGCQCFNSGGRIRAIEHISDIDVVYSSVDLVFIPSVVESLSNVLCEAISCGLPIAATRVGDSEVYAKNKNYSKIEFGGSSAKDLSVLLEQSVGFYYSSG